MATRRAGARAVHADASAYRQLEDRALVLARCYADHEGHPCQTLALRLRRHRGQFFAFVRCRPSPRPTMRGGCMPDRPGGTVAFHFTDSADSITRWEHHREQMQGTLARYDEMLRASWSSRINRSRMRLAVRAGSSSSRARP